MIGGYRENETTTETPRNSTPLRGQLSQAVAKERSAIDHELAALHNAIMEAHELISNLEQNISPVSTPVPTSDGTVSDRERVGSSTVYNSLHEATSIIHALQGRIVNIIQYLEV